MERVKQNLFSGQEVEVLKTLSCRFCEDGQHKATEITELSVMSGIKDNDIVLRALYTLEGKSLVSPQPPGDFTSNSWKITDTGIKALSLMPDSEIN